MRTIPFFIMLAAIGGIMAWELRDLFGESLWYGVPMFAVLIFAAVVHWLLQRPGVGARRRALIFGVGVVATVASLVFAAFVWSFIRLLVRGSWSFDAVWTVGALGAGALTVWLWFRFFKIVRQT